jgi:hypothetical protein
MADTGENRQISARTNAKEAETVRASQKMISQERTTARAADAAFNGPGEDSRPRTKKSKKLDRR